MGTRIRPPIKAQQTKAAIIRRMSMDTHMVRIYTGPLSQEMEFVSVEADKVTTVEEVLRVAVAKLNLVNCQDYELAEVYNTAGQLCKERRLGDLENPVCVQLLWPRIGIPDHELSNSLHTGYRFYIRKKHVDAQRNSGWYDCQDPPIDTFLTDFLTKPINKEYSDLCNLPDLNERTLLDNIKQRFQKQDTGIYTYVGSILIAVNPFQFYPIYNPKYVKMYQNKRLGDLPPHIFAIADAAFHTMLRTKRNQCIVISGESGSGKTESTNLLLHHLTALSHKGLHGSGVEQTILGAGPVLEAFGNAKTVHNNNSSRFGKFIQVNYKENGMVHGAIVEKYLLEKSRIVSQALHERNYHVFYYLLEGADDLEREKLHVGKAADYYYLSQSDCYNIDDVDEAGEFSRLKQSMEMVGFSQVTQKRIFGVLSAVLHLGNVKFKKKPDQHHDESVTITNQETIKIISQLLKVKEKTLTEALTQKRATAGDETVVMTHKLEDALATRDAMAKCLYGALFDWIVLKVNQALLAKRHNSEHQGNSIGVLDIFGFEDFSKNSFEQFCINYANEHLQYYFNQHIFKFEQEEYKKEGIQWKNIEFIDNTGCLELFSKKGNGLFSLLDEECNFPGATNDTLLSKFHHHHHQKDSIYYQAPQKREMSFVVVHYAGKVKYQIKDFREKNSDQIRTDIVANLKSSSLSFVRELMGVDPVAVLRWTILKTLVKSMFAFIKAGKQYRARGGPDPAVLQRRKQSSECYLVIPDLSGSHILSFYTCAKTINLLKKIHKRRSSPNDPRRRSPHPSMLEKMADWHAFTDFPNLEHEDDDVFPNSPRVSGHIRSPVDPYVSEDDARVMIEASRVLMKNKSFKPRSRPQTMFSDIKTLKAIANRTMYTGGKLSTKKNPPSVSAQFQWSLSRLMSTLNQANPFFIRCIKSNAEKEPCTFDDILVLRQLRYTGMLATVRIRQSGYNYRLTFEEFAQLYKILLPMGLQSEKQDIKKFLERTPMNKDNYQIGITKVFLRETEKMYLDECLHRAIMKRVVAIQRWVKTKVERKNFTQMRDNTIFIQKFVRSYLARRRLYLIKESVLMIQKWYRMVRVFRDYRRMRSSTICIQAVIRGHLQRKQYRQLKFDHDKLLAEQEALKHSDDMHSCTSDEGVPKDKDSADELEILKINRRDSEESSGILDDSESDTLSDAKSRGDSMSTPPPTPTTGVPMIMVQGLPGAKDPHLAKAGSRVSTLVQKYQPSTDGSPASDETDSRTVPGSIYIPRGSGRKRPPKMSQAPLAKQESFSDLESPSPTADRGNQLSPERLRMMGEKIKPRQTLQPTDNLQASADNLHRSPLRKAVDFISHQETLRETKSYPSAGDYSSLKRRLSISTSTLIRRTKSSIKLLREMKTTGGRRKKDSGADDSDDEMEQGKEQHSKRPHAIGIQVLPTQPMSPTSPKDETTSLTSFEEQEERHVIKKKRPTKRPDKENKENFSVAKASQWQYPDEFKISETYELQLLDEFIGRKIMALTKNCEKKESLFDSILTKCLKSFQMELKTRLSVVQKGTTFSIKYRDLFANFEVTMKATCDKEQVTSEFPVTMCLNAFRGFLDEFRNIVNDKKKDKKQRIKRPKNREKTKKDIIEHQGHKFSQVQFGIPTFCEMCSSIIWLMEKGHVCQICKYTCHRKCISKSTTPCKGTNDSDQRMSGTKVFGVPLRSLIGKKEKMPEFMENLITLIETHGLFTVGIYRISGGAHKIKTLKMVLDSGVKDVSIDDYAIHVLTSTLKTFLRELPEPLLTFDLYDEFMQASEIQDDKEALQVLFSITEKLPKINHDVFERLIFHLARVAHHEKYNKMSVNGLAIIFAPCLLRYNTVIKAQDMILHVKKQQICIEKILQEQLQKLCITLEDIKTLESAEVTANERLSVVRASMRNTKSPVASKMPEPPPSVSEDPETLAEQERVISSHIESLKKSKDELTSGLSNFDYRHSSDDEMLSVDEMESVYDTADEEYNRDETGSSFDVPAKPSYQLTHLTRNRANVPRRRLPSRYSLSDDRILDTSASQGTDGDKDNDIISSHHNYKRDTYISDITISLQHSAALDKVERQEQVTSVESGKVKKELGKLEHKDADTGKWFKRFPLSKPDSTTSSVSHKHVELTKPLALPSSAQLGSKTDLKDHNQNKDRGAQGFSPRFRPKLTRSQPVNIDNAPDIIREQKRAVSQSPHSDHSREPLKRQLSDSSLQVSLSSPGTEPQSHVLSSAIVGSPPRRKLRPILKARSVEVARISSYENHPLSPFADPASDDDEIMV